MSEDLKSQVAKFIDKTGYPFELEVASFLDEKGWAVFSSVEYYVPPDNQKREIDIIAYKIINNRRIELRISCKKSEDKPWIFFTTNNYYIKSGYDLKYTPASINFDKYSNIPKILEDLYFFKHDRWTVNYTAFSEKKQNESRNVITDAIMSAVTSTYQWLYPNLLNDDRGTIVFFTVLFKGSMFESYYNRSSNTHELEEIEYAQYETIFNLAQDNEYNDEFKKLVNTVFNRYKVEIVKWGYLENYLNNIEKVFSNLNEDEIKNFGDGWQSFFELNNLNE